MTILYILSQIFIIINYVFLVMTYQSKSRKRILIFNFGALIATGLSYVFLSAYSGLAMTFVAIIRNIIFIIDEKKNGKREKNEAKDYFILAILYFISIISAIFTYNGLLSMMSVLATMLYTYSVWQKDTKIYKILGIPVGIIWIIYNIYIFSIFGIILEVVLAISAVIGYKKEAKGNKSENKNIEGEGIWIWFIKKLQTKGLELARKLGFDYVISMAHPNNIGSCKTLEKVGLQFVKETRLSNGFLRKLYMLKLK